MLLSLGLSWPGPLQGCNNFKIHPPSTYGATRLHSQQAVRAIHRTGLCPGKLEARSEACSALSLKPKQDNVLNFPNRWSRAQNPWDPNPWYQLVTECSSGKGSPGPWWCPMCWWGGVLGGDIGALGVPSFRWGSKFHLYQSEMLLSLCGWRVCPSLFRTI